MRMVKVWIRRPRGLALSFFHTLLVLLVGDVKLVHVERLDKHVLLGSSIAAPMVHAPQELASRNAGHVFREFRARFHFWIGNGFGRREFLVLFLDDLLVLCWC
jgi:hypothetical protein